jgi:hypothetical protein
VLDTLSKSLPAACLFLLTTYRPEYRHSWGNKTHYTQLRLDPLPRECAREPVNSLLGDDAALAPLKQLLIERTGGNPFFLEESVRTLVEIQALIGERGAYRVAQALPNIQVPATGQAVLAARIDRLLPEEKRLLQTAAVIGPRCPCPYCRLLPSCPSRCCTAALCTSRPPSSSTKRASSRNMPIPSSTLSPTKWPTAASYHERQRALHARIVEGLEVRYADRLAEQVERLAYHAIRGEVWEKAVAYCQQAG